MRRRHFSFWKFEKSEEREYVQYMSGEDLASLRLILICITLMSAGFLAVDYYRETRFAYVVLFRGGLVLTCFSLLALTYLRALSPAAVQFFIQFILYADLFAFAMMGLFGNMPSFYFPNTIVLLFYMGSSVSGMRFRYAVVFNIVVLAIFTAMTFLTPPNDYVGRIPNVVSNFMLSTIAGAFIERAKRENFHQHTSLILQKDKLNELDQQKNRIISILSHDISAPLRSLHGIVRLFRNQHINQQEFHNLLPNLESQVGNANFLLHNLVRWSKSQLEGFKVEVKTIDLKDVVAESISLFEHQAHEKGISFQVNVQSEVEGDLEMIKLIVRNLVSNAVKFSYPDAVIGIHMINDGHTRSLCVANRGRPLDESVMPNFFTFQVKPGEGTSHEKGTGLGLAISQHFAQLNGCRIVFIPNAMDSELITFAIEWKDASEVRSIARETK
jgi:signal transduction histidine kinase